MEYFIIIGVIGISILLIKTIYKINKKDLKYIAENNQELDKIVKKYPSNTEICKAILKKIQNEQVIIEEDNNVQNCLYIVISNKIIIADLRESFTRIQTIAHECLHSIQDRTILLFNFIYSNIYIFYFYLVSILGACKLLTNKLLFLNLLILLSFIYYFVRSYLENDAMIKARFLAKEYMEEIKISEKQEIERIVKEYDKLNNIGIKAVNYSLFLNVTIRIAILALIFCFR